MPRQLLSKFWFRDGYATDLSVTEGNGYMRQGSRNMLVSGAGLIFPFRGLTAYDDVVGGRQHFLTDDSFASLGTLDSAGQGSVFRAIGHLMYIGQGRVLYEGQDTTRIATTQLAYLTRNGPVFDAGSLDYDMGHARPSAPELFARIPPGPGQKPMNAVVAMVIWRADSLTGQPSIPSESVTISLANASVIVKFPEADTNGQDVWGLAGTLLGVQIGNLYALPVDIGGEVQESYLSYTRAIAQASGSTASTNITLNVATPVGERFTSADVGRRIKRTGVLDSKIVSITDAFTAVVDIEPSANFTDQPVTVVHAIDGIERAAEISWSDDDLLAIAELAPFEAFVPPDGRFGGVLMDTAYVEDVDGNIFYSIPNTFSFPRKNRRIYTEDKATVYVDTGQGFHWRIAKQSVSRLYYVPGLLPVQLDVMSKNIGCRFPQNACLGYNGRLMVWTGRPTVIDDSINSTFHTLIATEFKDWEQQVEATPVVPAYDPIGQYELWCYQNKILAMHAPSGRWCAPIDISTWTNGDIVSQVIIDEELYLGVSDDNYVASRTMDISGTTETIITDGFPIPAEYVGLYVYKGDELLGVIDSIDGTDAIILEPGPGVTEPGQELTFWRRTKPAYYTGIRLWKWNSGPGSPITIKSFYKELPGMTSVTEVEAVVKAGSTESDMTYYLSVNFDREDLVGVDTVPNSPATQLARSFRPNSRDADLIAVKIESELADGDMAVDYVNCQGEWNQSWSSNR